MTDYTWHPVLGSVQMINIKNYWRMLLSLASIGERYTVSKCIYLEYNFMTIYSYINKIIIGVEGKSFPEALSNVNFVLNC